MISVKLSVATLVFLCVTFQANSLELDGINCKILLKKLKIKDINLLYLPHEDDCGAFYHCGLSGAVLESCGEGTIFSLRNRDCRRPGEGKCITLERYLEIKQIKLDDFYEEREY